MQNKKEPSESIVCFNKIKEKKNKQKTMKEQLGCRYSFFLLQLYYPGEF